MAGNSITLVWDLIANDRASGTFNRVGSEAERASLGVGKLLGGFTALAAGGAIAASVKAAADFQSSMLLIQTQAGASRAEVEKMTPAILALAGQVAQAPEALATSLYHVESTGLRGSKALDAVRVAAEGAKVGHADLEQTTNALTATIASGMLPATETYAQAMGQLNTIVGSGDMKMQDLNDALASGLLVVTKQYGVGINDVGAALATFGDNNIRGADAATMLRMAVQAIQNPGKKAAAALGEIGLTVEQLRSDEQTGGLNKALTDLHTHLVNSGIDASQWGTILTDAFTKKAGSGLITLVGQFDRFQQKYKEVSDGANSFGDSWAATTKSANFQFAALGDSVQSLGIRIGTALLPYVTDLAKHVNDFLNSRGFKDFLDTAGTAAVAAGHGIGSLVSAFADLPAPIKEVAAAFVLLKLADHLGLTDRLSSSVSAAGASFRNFSADVSATRGVLEHAGVPLAGFSAALQTTAERGMSALRSAGKNVLDMMGGPWGAGLLGATAYVGALQAGIQHATDTENKWTDALKQGGQAMEQARSEMDKTAAAEKNLNGGFAGFAATVGGVSNQIKMMTPDADKASKAYQDWYNSLGLVDQKSQDVQLATANLSAVMKNHSADSLAVQEAIDKVRRAEQDQKVATDELNQSTKTSVQLSQEQANALLALTGSSLAVKQSYDEFQSSYQQLLSDQAKGQLSTAQLTNEQDALNQSALNVASSAGTAGAAWAKANGVTDTATASQYAQLLALEKVSDAMGTNTPASIRTLIASLQASVAQGHLTQAQMDGVTAAVDGIPGQKKIDVTADTKAAQDAINGLLGMYNHVQYAGSAILVNGRVVANADGNLLEAYASGGMRPMPSSVAQVIQPGTLRVIGDNPVSAEAFIPLNKSTRSQQILSEAASRMGFGLHAMADGGITDQFRAQPSQSMLDSLKATVQAHVQAQAVAASAGGAARWAPMVDQVLAMLGISRSAEAGVLAMINSESGGNPNAINMWDSNAKAGHPSQGLMQTIPGTFARWRNPSLPNNILDPLANIYAGVNYALHTYGVGMLMGGGNRGAGGKYVGYKDGTNFVPETGLGLLHRGEAVVPVAKNQGAPFQGGGPITLQLDAQATSDLLEGRAVQVVAGGIASLRNALTY